MESYEVMEQYFPGTLTQLDSIFYGMAIPCDKTTSDKGTIRSEKVLKFSKSAIKANREKDNKRREKIRREKTYAKLVAFYNTENITNEVSPFEDDWYE